MSAANVKPLFIYSTLASDVTYTFWKPKPKDNPSGPSVKEYEITIKGGANVADKHGVSVRGKVTEISGEDYERLKKHSVFAKHKENGFIWVDVGAKPVDTIVNGAMEARDKSAPITPESFTKAGKKAPKVAKVE
jgi:hypothetical protein